ncbi:hypothetical protein [Frigidibacter oleivorans]|uniref:hypothetical protein n=1 Tax=Frigidibacter oleivorans TaxID=2487129 RepID=UPI000F8CB8E1|nr:hypothetical protein [Frigidibacter oleivorans]
MPKLVRLYLRNILVGVALSVVFVGLLIALDVAGLRHLLLGTQAGPIALVMLLVFNAIVFAGVQFGIAVMRMAEPEDRAGGPGRPAAAPPTTAVPAPVPAPASRPLQTRRPLRR